MRILPVYFLFD